MLEEPVGQTISGHSKHLQNTLSGPEHHLAHEVAVHSAQQVARLPVLHHGLAPPHTDQPLAFKQNLHLSLWACAVGRAGFASLPALLHDGSWDTGNLSTMLESRVLAMQRHGRLHTCLAHAVLEAPGVCHCLLCCHTEQGHAPAGQRLSSRSTALTFTVTMFASPSMHPALPQVNKLCAEHGPLPRSSAMSPHSLGS